MSSPSPGMCLDGFKGYPIEFTNISTVTSEVEYIVPKTELELQFGPSEIPMTFISGVHALPSLNDTFILSSLQYGVRTIIYAAQTQKGLSGDTENDLGEFQIWGSSISDRYTGYNLAVLIIPVRKASQSTNAGIEIVKALTGNRCRLQRCIPMSASTFIHLYSTCTETNKPKTLNINVAYWPGGASVTNELANKLVGVKKTPANVVPPIIDSRGVADAPKLLTLTGGIDTITKKYRNPVYNYTTPVNGIWTVNGQVTDLYLLMPYSNMKVSANSKEFNEGFRVIKGFDITKPADRMNTFGYKCMAINPETDIKDGRILVDVRTGKRLDHVLADEDQYLSSLAKDSLPAAYASKNLGKQIAIFVGVVVGLAGLAGIIFFVNWIISQKEPGKGVLEAAASVAGSISGTHEVPAVKAAGIFARLSNAGMTSTVFVSILAVLLTGFAAFGIGWTASGRSIYEFKEVQQGSDLLKSAGEELSETTKETEEQKKGSTSSS
jgi:hypothetical protein